MLVIVLIHYERFLSLLSSNPGQNVETSFTLCTSHAFGDLGFHRYRHWTLLHTQTPNDGCRCLSRHFSLLRYKQSSSSTVNSHKPPSQYPSALTLLKARAMNGFDSLICLIVSGVELATSASLLLNAETLSTWRRNEQIDTLVLRHLTDSPRESPNKAAFRLELTAFVGRSSNVSSACSLEAWTRGEDALRDTTFRSLAHRMGSCI